MVLRNGASERRDNRAVRPASTSPSSDLAHRLLKLPQASYRTTELIASHDSLTFVGIWSVPLAHPREIKFHRQ